MVTLKLFRNIFLILLFSSVTFAKAVPNLSVFVGTQEGIAFPKSFRLLWKEVEVGTYSRSIGLTKVIGKDNFYANFGLGLSRQGEMSPGFVGGVGYHYVTSFMLGFKVDWSTFAAVNGFVSSEPSIGLTLNW